MTDIFRVQQYDYTDPNAVVYLADLDFETLVEAIDYCENNAIPANHDRALLYKYHDDTSFYLYSHNVSTADIISSKKDKIKLDFFNGYSLDFNGVSQGIQFDDSHNFNPTDAFTVSFWMKVKKQDVMQGMVGKKDGTFGTGWACGLFDDNTLCFTVRSDPHLFDPEDFGSAILVKGAYTPPSNQWVNLTFTKSTSSDASGVSVFADGQSISMITAQNNLSGDTTNTVDLRFALADDGSSGYEGELTQCFISNAECTPAEALELYNDGTPMDLTTFSNFASVLSWWQLGNNTVLPDIVDEVGNVDGVVENVTIKNMHALPHKKK